jgi:hypothetical protein
MADALAWDSNSGRLSFSLLVPDSGGDELTLGLPAAFDHRQLARVELDGRVASLQPLGRTGEPRGLVIDAGEHQLVGWYQG